MSIPRTNQHSAMRVNFLVEGYKNCFQLTLDKQLTNYNSDTLTTKPPKPFWSLKCLVDWISSWMLGYNPIICGPNFECRDRCFLLRNTIDIYVPVYA